MPKAKLELIVSVTLSPGGDHATENLPVEVEYMYWGYDPVGGERVVELIDATWLDPLSPFTTLEMECYSGEIQDKVDCLT